MIKKYQYLIDHILANNSQEDFNNLKAYHHYHHQISDELNAWIIKKLHDHPSFGSIIGSLSDEDQKKQNSMSTQYQKEALFANNWEPLILHLVETGMAYARMGVDFYMWHDVMALAHNFILPKILEDDSLEVSKKMAILNGTNRYFDIAMSAIGEAYLNESRSIIEDQKQQQEKINKELKRSLNQLKDKNQELEQFAYVASHDLQEPLRMVTSFLTQLKNKYNDKLDDKARRYIHFAVDGATRMRRIILDLLDFSRVGNNDHEYEQVDMNATLQEVLQLNSQSIKENEVTIESDTLPEIHAAKVSMQQVMQNLIGNALKYHNDGEKLVIRIKASETDEHWHFTVTDNGIGIEPQYFNKIFVLFQRLHNKTEYTGTGIGLALCKKIVEHHDGNIWVESEPGQGSTFHFTISKHL